MSERLPQVVVDFQDAHGCYERLANRLVAGVHQSDHAFHWPTVTTVDGDRPAARTVVLRGFDPTARTVTFHTDVRSSKVDQLKQNNRVSLHFYDNEIRLQLILAAVADLHCQDDVSHAEWQAASPSSRSAYAEPLPAGTVTPSDAPVTALPPVDAGNLVVYAHFVAVVCRVSEMEVLELLPSGNRRVKLSWPRGELTLDRLSP